MSSTHKKVSRWKTLYLIFSVAMGICVGFLGQSFIQDNKSATNVIVTVFSILAGFLIAVFSLLSNPAFIMRGSWRIASLQRNEIRRRLIKHKILFYLYLLVLALILCNSMIEDRWLLASRIIEHVFLGIATTGFLLSFTLPTEIINFQIDYFDHEIRNRKSNSD